MTSAGTDAKLKEGTSGAAFTCGHAWRLNTYAEYEERANVMRAAVEKVLKPIRASLELKGYEELVITGSLAHGVWHGMSDVDVAVVADTIERLQQLRTRYVDYIQNKQNAQTVYGGASFPMGFTFTTKPPACLPWVPAYSMNFGPGLVTKFDFTFRTTYQHSWIAP